MIHITTQHHLHLCVEPIDFRKGIDALVGLCRQNIGSPYNPKKRSCADPSLIKIVQCSLH
jgi:hypothetical protein